MSPLKRLLTDTGTSTRATAVRIGVTGHRVLIEVEKVTQGIDVGLRLIGPFIHDRPLVVLSALADGADRLTVQRILTERPDATLTAILPLVPKAYAKDFVRWDSQQEFELWLNLARHVEIVSPEFIEPISQIEREEAYARANKRILEDADILIAVWDGQPSQGRGGTGDMVEGARKMQKKIVWVHAGNRQPNSFASTSLGVNQGKVSLENFF